MNITWLGHACFLFEQNGYRIVLDPYRDVAGYPPLQVQAHEVLCSHHHFDHDFVDAVTLLPKRPSPFSIRTVEVFHDDQSGALRGPNTIHILTAEGSTVAHLGDLGHLLTAEQLSKIGRVDALLVPVGGVYTLDAAGAKAVCEAIQAPCVIPMHYRHPPFGLPDVGGVEEFLSLWPQETIHSLSGNTFSPMPGVLVPQFLFS